MLPWIVFFSVAILLLAFDIFILNKNEHEIKVKESLWLSLFYISVALLFGLFIGYLLGSIKMTQYYTGYLVEQSLSLDNLFVFSLIFKYFIVPKRLQHRVLFWGIISVFILRGIMIFGGSAIVSHFDWVLYIFALFLIIMGIKMLFIKESQELNLEKNFLLKFLKKHWRITPEFHGKQFLIKSPHPKKPTKKVLWLTPLLVVLLLIEFADIVFAIDSIPAIFVITTDPYIVYTSNIFAIFGLRALYFALDAILDKFKYLHQSLAIILIFIGSKAFIPHFSSLLSLGITIFILLSGIGLSLRRTPTKR
jgi:tellurite resistance protein TerC